MINFFTYVNLAFEIEHINRIILTSLTFNYILITCFMTKFFAYVNLAIKIELPRNVINEYQVNMYIFSPADDDSADDRGKDFRYHFETLAGSIKTKLELSFIVDIASFQLAQKSSNLVMFWLFENAVKFH